MDNQTNGKTIENPSNPALTPAEIIRNATIIEEGIKLCPLCTSEVRLFFINFNEKVLMCENVNCDYPFGEDEVIYVKEDDEIQSYEEVVSIKPTLSPSISHSVISTAAWSDLARMNLVNDSEEQINKDNNKIRGETREYFINKVKATQTALPKDQERKKLLKELQVIHEKDKEMSSDTDYINNEKWVKTLMKLQKSSGITLLKEEEMKLFKKSKPDLGLGELTIDIGMGRDTNNMSTIKIEIANVKDT